MAVVPVWIGISVIFSIAMGCFFVFIALYREVQTKTEKMRTTKYIPMQNSRGWREPNMSWRFVFFIRYFLGPSELGYRINTGTNCKAKNYARA
jgi:hypothetical protein